MVIVLGDCCDHPPTKGDPPARMALNQYSSAQAKTCHSGTHDLQFPKPTPYQLTHRTWASTTCIKTGVAATPKPRCDINRECQDVEQTLDVTTRGSVGCNTCFRSAARGHTACLKRRFCTNPTQSMNQDPQAPLMINALDAFSLIARKHSLATLFWHSTIVEAKLDCQFCP